MTANGTAAETTATGGAATEKQMSMRARARSDIGWRRAAVQEEDEIVEGEQEVMVMVVIVNMPRLKRPVYVFGVFCPSTAATT